MSFTMLATFVARVGTEDELVRQLRAMVEPSRAEPGCLQYRPLVDPERPGTVVMLQEWADQAALDAHFASEHFVSIAPQLADLIGEPIAIAELAPNPERTDLTVTAEDLRALAG
jgi:quinol monooxygenase YgiN